jgi:FHS family L-fucose permease-like MFS transporter
MSAQKKGMFVTPDGRNVVATFALVSSLFLLWGFCNGMIDVMDKHFQTELKLTLAQSAWVQFAHYLGYFLMALPAGWLATRLGYKGGIVAGLLMVAVGGFWFIPATRIASFWAFLLGAFFYGKDESGASTGAQTLWIPYAFVGVVVVLLAAVFLRADVPDIKTEDDYHLDDAGPDATHSIWDHPHFWMAVIAQFLYVAAQAGIFSFFINYMTSQTPPLPDSWRSGFLRGWIVAGADGALQLTDQGAANLASLGFVFFLAGRFSGAAILRKYPAHRVLGLYGLVNTALCLLVALKLGWFSVAGVFLSYFFMSIMFPTIFALGIHGLGVRAKKASAYIVMAIMGGALLPKLMGHVGDLHGMSRAFLVPLASFAFVAIYGFSWPRLSGVSSLHGVKAGEN